MLSELNWEPGFNSFCLPHSDSLSQLIFNEHLLTVWQGFPAGANGKESDCQRKRHGFDPWIGKIPRVENGNPFWYSCLGNSMGRGDWWAIVLGAIKS